MEAIRESLLFPLVLEDGALFRLERASSRTHRAAGKIIFFYLFIL